MLLARADSLVGEDGIPKPYTLNYSRMPYMS